MATIKNADGTAAEVDGKHRLTTFATSQSENKNINSDGGAFSIHFVVTPLAADDYFFCLKNNGTKNINFTKIRISSSVPTSIIMDHTAGIPVFVGETAADVTNRKLGDSTPLIADVFFDTDITGLASQGVLMFEECAVADTLYTSKITSDIIIPQGQTVAIRRGAATGTIEMLISVIVDQ